ncbi:MAG: Asp-tRNA(Asn)/Glu-tRNA(Gln) amidotransferase subunit GatC [Planctomycetes bacterium]|nr:Asp-tRNA(Asn)/Glu-tRNA(Gln) amidotransferase subunit GatC [Planctomycetota bacterium]
MDVTDELVAKIARLSRLALGEEESAEMKEHFRKVLGFVSELESLDLEGVAPSLFALDASNVQREDEPAPSLPAGAALANAPAAHPPFFLVPRIVGDAGEPEMSP